MTPRSERHDCVLLPQSGKTGVSVEMQMFGLE